jgi:hypothetical protein
MHKNALFFALSVGLALTAACGDKIEPLAGEATDTEAGSTDTTAGNTNTTAGNTNTTAGNTNSTPTTGLCGTSATTISYATHIAPLVTSACSSCHGSGGTPPTMTTFTNTKSAFSSGTAKSEVDSRNMPRGASLTTNQICLFDTWATTNYSP